MERRLLKKGIKVNGEYFPAHYSSSKNNIIGRARGCNMTKSQAREAAESRLETWINNSFYDDDNYLADNPLVLKEMKKARNRCLKVLGYEPRTTA